MKRHEALAPLSREHHNSLILAQLLKKDAPVYKGLPETLNDKAAYSVKHYKETLIQHFEKEEKLLQKVKNFHPDIEQLAAEITSEHQVMKALFYALEHAGSLEALLDHIGVFLENHIRKEERLLFPLIQEHCPEEILNTI